jgi:hypothetical protein
MDNNTFIINKSSVSIDLSKIFPILSELGDDIINNISLGSTYIRIASDDNKIVTQIPYDKNLILKKYSDKINEIINHNKIVKKQKQDNKERFETDKSFMNKWIIDNKYAFDPFILRYELKNNTISIISDNNFIITCKNINKSKIFDVVIDKSLIDDLQPKNLKSHDDYIAITTHAIEKISRIQKVITLIIHNLNDKNQ